MPATPTHAERCAHYAYEWKRRDGRLDRWVLTDTSDDDSHLYQVEVDRSTLLCEKCQSQDIEIISLSVPRDITET